MAEMKNLPNLSTFMDIFLTSSIYANIYTGELAQPPGLSLFLEPTEVNLRVSGVQHEKSFWLLLLLAHIVHFSC